MGFGRWGRPFGRPEVDPVEGEADRVRGAELERQAPGAVRDANGAGGARPALACVRPDHPNGEAWWHRPSPPSPTRCDRLVSLPQTHTQR